MIIEDSYIRATSLIGFAEIVGRDGCDASTLLDDAGISRTALTEVDGLVTFLTVFDYDVEIIVRPRINLRGQVSFLPVHTST